MAGDKLLRAHSLATGDTESSTDEMGRSPRLRKEKQEVGWVQGCHRPQTLSAPWTERLGREESTASVGSEGESPGSET